MARGRRGRGGREDIPELLSAFGKACACEVWLAPVEVAHVPEGEARTIRSTHAVSDGTQAGSVSGKAKAHQKTGEGRAGRGGSSEAIRVADRQRDSGAEGLRPGLMPPVGPRERVP